MGRALLSRHDDAEVERIVSLPSARPQMTSGSTTTLSSLSDRLQDARVKGYAFDEGGLISDAVCFAMLVPEMLPGEPVLALGVTIVGSTPNPEYRDAVVAELREAVIRLGHPSFG